MRLTEWDLKNETLRMRLKEWDLLMDTLRMRFKEWDLKNETLRMWLFKLSKHDDSQIKLSLLF